MSTSVLVVAVVPGAEGQVTKCLRAWPWAAGGWAREGCWKRRPGRCRCGLHTFSGPGWLQGWVWG